MSKFQNQGVSLDENLEEILENVASVKEEPEVKIANLYRKIRLLKDISGQLLVELKQCRESFCEANTMVGECNGHVKKIQ